MGPNFDDQDVLAALGRAIECLVAAKDPGEKFRAWSIGTSTGEEAYTIAMFVREACERQGKDLHVQVFATDVLDASLEIARTGVYAAERMALLDEGRRARWFVPEPGGGLRVRDELRKSVVFARHDVLRHAPLGKMDVISCRNALALAPASAPQRDASRERLFAVAHYSLVASGLFALGAAEELGSFASCFDAADLGPGLYRRSPSEADVVRRFLLTPKRSRSPAPRLAATRAEIAERQQRKTRTRELLDEMRRLRDSELCTLAQLEAQEQLVERAGLALRVADSLAATGSGVFGTTRERRVVWMCGRVFGCGEREVVGEELDNLLAENDASQLAELARDALSTQALARRALVITVRGRPTLAEVQVRPTRHDATELTWFVQEL